eukprot:s1406_g3.t1
MKDRSRHHNCSGEVLIEMRQAFLCSRLACERLLGSPPRLVPNAAGTPVPRSPSDGLSAASQLPKPSEGQTAERSQDEAAPVPPAPPAEAHRELAAFCVTKGYVLRFDGFESLPSGFRCVFRVEFRRNGQVVSEARSDNAFAACWCTREYPGQHTDVPCRGVTIEPLGMAPTSPKVSDDSLRTTPQPGGAAPLVHIGHRRSFPALSRSAMQETSMAFPATHRQGRNSQAGRPT